MAHRITSGLALAVAVLAHGGCYDAEATGGGAGASGGASAGNAGNAGNAGALNGGSSGAAGSHAGSSSGQGGSAGQGGGSGGNAGAGNAGPAGAAGDSGNDGAGEGGGPSSSGGGTGEGGAADAGGMSGDAGASDGHAGGGDGAGSAGDAGAGGESGDNAGSGGSAGGDVGPSCAGGDVPLVWLLLSTSSGMFGETKIGPTEAWYVVRTALTGADGALAELEGHASVGLTWFAGVATETCPSYQVVEPNTDTSAAAALIDSVAPPATKQESPLPTAYAATLELVRARPETDKTIVIIANSVPDFCNDGAAYCARDAVVSHVQAAFDDGIRTLLVGIDHPIDTNSTERLAYFQAVANAGSGHTPAIFADRFAIEASCSGQVLAEYGTASQQASWISGNASSTTFESELEERLVALGCP